MNVYETHAAPHEFVLLNHGERFVVGCHGGVREQLQKREGRSVAEIAAGQFAHHHRVNANLVCLKRCAQLCVTPAQMIDPD